MFSAMFSRLKLSYTYVNYEGSLKHVACFSFFSFFFFLCLNANLGFEKKIDIVIQWHFSQFIRWFICSVAKRSLDLPLCHIIRGFVDSLVCNFGLSNITTIIIMLLYFRLNSVQGQQDHAWVMTTIWDMMYVRFTPFFMRKRKYQWHFFICWAARRDSTENVQIGHSCIWKGSDMYASATHGQIWRMHCRGCNVLVYGQEHLDSWVCTTAYILPNDFLALVRSRH